MRLALVYGARAMREAEKRDELLRLRRDLEQALRKLDRLIGTPPGQNQRRLKRRKFDLVCEILREHPKGLTIHALVTQMRKRGYVFVGDPVMGTRTLLYTRSEFKSDHGVFTLSQMARGGQK